MGIQIQTVLSNLVCVAYNWYVVNVYFIKDVGNFDGYCIWIDNYVSIYELHECLHILEKLEWALVLKIDQIHILHLHLKTIYLSHQTLSWQLQTQQKKNRPNWYCLSWVFSLATQLAIHFYLYSYSIWTTTEII